MMSLFPELLDFPVFAALILRLVAGGFFMVLAVRFFRILARPDYPARARILGGGFAVLELVTGGMLFVGLLTQGAALAGMFLTSVSIALGFGRGSHPSEAHVQLLLHVMCLALLFLGAGPFAFDIPL